MTLMGRLQRIERAVGQRHAESYDDILRAPIRAMSDQELDDAIARMRAEVGEDEFHRMGVALEGGPAAVRAYLDD